MTREQAARQAKKRWGSSAHIRAHESRSSPEMRAEAHARFVAARDGQEAVEKEIHDRLAACDWYQELSARRQVLRKEKEAVMWTRCYRRFAVGTSNGLGFHVQGEGDTWEEAFAAAEQREKVTT